MFRKTKLGRSITLALGGTLALTAFEGLAQTGDRVEITGSLIRRIDGEQALPVVTLKSEDLQKQGVTNAEQAVRFITQQQGGTVASGSVSSTNGAASYANLRNLGAGRTLVLLNGKRVVNNPFSSTAVDLNTLPMAAVDRIETLPDGASATYGTDAIAGVINFITKRDYKGGAIGVTAQVTEAGGGDVYSGSVVGGIGDLGTQGWNVFGSLNIRQQKPMGGLEREFSRTSYIPERGFNGLSPTTFPANYSQTVGGRTIIANTNPSLPNCDPPTSLFAPQPVVGLGTTRCGADTQTYTQTVPDQDQKSAFLRGSLALGANHVASLEYFKSVNKLTSFIAPSPEGGLTMPPTSPFYPGNGITPITNTALDRTQPISIAWRTTALGSRSGVQENNTDRIVAGLEGTLAGWDYNVALLKSNSKITNDFLNGYPGTTGLLNGIRGLNGAPWLNPFGAQTAAGQAYLESIEVLGRVQEGEGNLESVTASVSRSLFKLPGGNASIALAGEFRKEDMVYRTNVPLVSQAASSGLAGAGALREGERDIKALALELNLPLLKGLDVGLSVRTDKYSDFGNASNPKVSLRYAPNNMLLLRGSANTGFSAPALTDLYLPNSTTFTAARFNDPVLCPNGVPAANGVPARDCGIQFQRLTGGNPDLTAEESRAWTVGFVVQATSQISFGLDYWHYYVKNSFGAISAESIFGDPVKWANLFVRCSQAPADRQAAIGACRTPGGDPLAYVLTTNQNLGDYETSGVDIQFNWNSGATSMGRFGAAVRGTYVQKYLFQEQAGGPWYGPLGNFTAQFTQSGSAGPAIRYTQVTNFTWDSGPWSAGLANRFLRGYRDQNAVPAPFNNNYVGDYSLWDLSVSYKGIKGLTLAGSVLNLRDSDPPFSNQVSRFQARGYDDRFHNPLGRTYQVSARYEF